MTKENSFLQTSCPNYYKQLQPDDPVKIKPFSPHQVVFVLISSHLEYKGFVVSHNLPRTIYQYLWHPSQLMGKRWDNAYLLRVGNWHMSPLLVHDDGHWELDMRFPGWKD
jgi:hypothetical protein